LALWLCAVVFLILKTNQDPFLDAAVSFVGAACLSVIGALFWIARRRQKRLRLIEQQLPLALDIVVRSLRAGHPVIMAIKLSSSEMGDPIGSEIGLVVDETTYGVEFRQALANLATRTGSNYLHFFAITVSIQAETGGNLGEILGNLTKAIRDQQSLHLRVRALASEGKMSAMMLSLIPVFVVASVMLMQPNYYSNAMHVPLFWTVTALIAALYGLGQFIIFKIVNFKY
jgi:tight adherence protein B